MQGLLTNKLWVILNTSQLFLNDEVKSEDGFVAVKPVYGTDFLVNIDVKVQAGSVIIPKT